MEYRPVAQWLRSTRLRQTMPSGEPWTQEHLLDRMQEEIGWAPARPNYSRYENGKATPTRETLAKLADFWSRHGEPGPDFTPPVVEEPVDPQLALARALERHAAALEATSMAGPAGSDTLPPGLAAMLESLISEQRETRAMLERVLSTLAVASVPFDPGELADFHEWKREREPIVTQARPAVPSAGR